MKCDEQVNGAVMLWTQAHTKEAISFCSIFFIARWKNMVSIQMRNAIPAAQLPVAQCGKNETLDVFIANALISICDAPKQGKIYHIWVPIDMRPGLE